MLITGKKSKQRQSGYTLNVLGKFEFPYDSFSTGIHETYIYNYFKGRNFRGSGKPRNIYSG